MTGFCLSKHNNLLDFCILCKIIKNIRILIKGRDINEAAAITDRDRETHDPSVPK